MEKLMVVAPLVPALREAVAGKCLEFEARLVYRTSHKTARTTHREILS